MSDSFPYFSLSQRLGIPYPQVLDKIDLLEFAEPQADDRRVGWPTLTVAECDAIDDAWRGEVTRRRPATAQPDRALEKL